MKRGRRVALAFAVVAGLMLATVVTRWFIARERVADVARSIDAARPLAAVASSSKQPEAFTAPGRSEPEAAARAAVHQHAVESYQRRAESDLKRLPPAYQALNDERLAELKRLADEGNARAACVLAAQISKCAYFPGVAQREGERAQRRIDEEQRAGRVPSAQMMSAFERISAMQGQLKAECEGIHISPEHAAWRYQLQAALLGHVDSMMTFSTWPAIDITSPGDSLDAIAAYLEYSGPFIETLAQRGSLNAVTQAAWSYGDSGPSIMREIGVRELPYDPTRSLMFYYVRTAIMRRWETAEPGSSMPWGKPEAGSEALERSVSQRDRQWARQMADQMIASFDAKAFQPPTQTSDRSRPGNFWEAAEDACRE